MIGYVFEYYKYIRYTKESLSDLDGVMDYNDAKKTFLTFGEFDRLKVNCVEEISRFRDLSELGKNWLGNRQSLLFYSLETEPAYCYYEKEGKFGFYSEEEKDFDDHLFIGLTEFPFKNNIRTSKLDYEKLVKIAEEKVKNKILKFLKEKNYDITFMIFGSLGNFGISVLWFGNQYTEVLDIINYIKTENIDEFFSAHTIFSQNPNANKQNIDKIKGKAFIQITLKRYLPEEKFILPQATNMKIIATYHTSGQYDVLLEVDAKDAYNAFNGNSFLTHVENLYQKEILQTSVIFGKAIGSEYLKENLSESSKSKNKPEENKFESLVNNLREIQSQYQLVREKLKQTLSTSTGVVDTFDSLMCDYRSNVVSAVNEHWAIDFSHIFKNSLKCIREMLTFVDAYPEYDIDFLEILRIMLNNLKQQIFHMAESNSLEFEIPKCHLRYTGQEDCMLFGYMNIIKEILKQAYCLKGINNQTEIIPIVTVDTVPIIESALYFDKTNFYTTDLKEADQEFKFLDINLPHVCFYDMPTYIKYLYHEIYHYIVPENREQRNIYMGQFLVSIGYEKLIMGIIECCLRKTENSEKVKEFVFPIVASIISNIYPQIHFDLKSKYKIQTKDVNSVFHTREIYKKVLFKYLQLDIQNWIEKKESKFAEILIALHEHLNKNKIVEGLEHFSYDSLRECISESDIENIEKYLTDSQIIENIGFYLETLLPQINRIFLNIVNGLKEASADIPMIEMTEMSLEEYLNLYILCQKNLLKKIVPPEQPDNKEIFRIIMVLNYFKREKQQILNDKTKKYFRSLFYTMEMPKHPVEDKNKLFGIFNTADTDIENWWSFFTKINKGFDKKIFDIHAEILEKLMETIKVSNRNESDNDLKNIFVSRKDIINSYGNKFFKISNYGKNISEEMLHEYNDIIQEKNDFLFRENIQIMLKFQTGLGLDRLSIINTNNNSSKGKIVQHKLISESVRLNIETQRYNFMSESKHEIYSCRVFGITELMDAFERITNKLKCSCEKTIPKVENDLWYRGQMNGQYELLPSIMRPNLTERTQFGYLAQYQRYLFEKFKYRADGTPEIMDSSQFTISDYLALMQHYQVKTNLMDWSEDAFTGIYFALEKFITGEIKEIVNSPSIQIFSPGLYNRARKQMIDLGVTDLSENQKAFKASLKTTGGRSGEIPNIATGYNEEIYNMFLLGNRKYETEDCYGYKEEIKISGGKELAFLPLAIYTSRLNPRMRTQSGMFLAYNLYTEPSLKNEYGYMSLEKIQEYYMNECKAENKQQFLYKIMIDKKSVKEIADCFIALGLSTEKIYPELSNIGSKIR